MGTDQCGARTGTTPNGCGHPAPAPGAQCAAGHIATRTPAGGPGVADMGAVTTADPLADRLKTVVAKQQTAQQARHSRADRRSIRHARRGLRKQLGLRRGDYDVVSVAKGRRDRTNVTVQLRRDDDRRIELTKWVSEPGGRMSASDRFAHAEGRVSTSEHVQYREYRDGRDDVHGVVSNPAHIAELLRRPA